MFRQFGGLDIDPLKVYTDKNNPGFRDFLKEGEIGNVAEFEALTKEERLNKLNMYNRVTRAVERFGKTPVASSDVEYTKDEEGKVVYGDRRFVEKPQPDKHSKTFSQALMSCNSVSQCEKFDSDDIRFELERRNFTNGRDSKYITDAQGKYITDAQGKRVEADFYLRTTKPELIRILLGHNKQFAKTSRLQGKLETSLKSARGAFPSESTNPRMYDEKTGLLQEKYLTIDHHGLTAYDIKGDRFRVEWTPFGDNGGGKAKWVKDVSQTPYGTQQMSGVFQLDSRGLPRLDQLTYKNNILQVHKDKKGKLLQVHVDRKNKKSKSMAIQNAKLNRDGTPKLVWGKYDPSYSMDAKVGEATKKKFVTPLGLFTYDQLMKMPLDNILKMMIVLELAEESPKQALKMKELGVGPFAPGGVMSKGRLTGRQSTGLVEAKEKTTSRLNSDEKMLEEQAYKMAKFPKCEYPEPAQRCYTDSYIPGTCVPDEKMCFDPKLREPYKAYVARKEYKADKFIQASEGIDHQYVTKQDINDLYKAM